MLHRIATAIAAAAACLAALPASAEVYGGVSRDEPLPRFEDRLCPGVTGLQRDQAEQVVGLIRQTAGSLDIPLADPASCEPNLLVAVVLDGRSFMKNLYARQPWLFSDLGDKPREELFERESPARSFVWAITRTRDGMMVDRRETLDAPPQTTMAMAHSKIYVPTRRDIVSAFVLIDKSALEGLNVQQLADYAVMRGLTGDSADEVTMPGGSILSLFDAGETRPAGLAPSDRIFLQTLYGTLPNNPAALTLSIAQRRIDEQVLAE